LRKLYKQPMPPGIEPTLQAMFNQIVEASQSGDITDIGGGYTLIGAAPTPTRILNVTSPTLANVVAVVATLLADLKAGGANRTN
jgi:hypothetical protein